MELSRLIQHPEEMNRETLYDLRALLALYPHYQTARLLMLRNLYLLHAPSFDEELRKAAIYITDRKVIFQMIEAAHYQLNKTQATGKQQVVSSASIKPSEKEMNADRTSDLIDNFLGSIPMEANGEEKKKEKRKPTPADAAVDYVAYLMETEDKEEADEPSRTISLIDDFMEDGGFKLQKLEQGEDYKPEYTPDIENEDAKNEGDEENSGVFTETLARIYIKQGKYQRAYAIIDRLYKQHPQKNSYYVDQLRFLEKLMRAKKKK